MCCCVQLSFLPCLPSLCAHAQAHARPSLSGCLQDLAYKTPGVLGYAATWPQAAAALPQPGAQFDWEGDRPLGLAMEDLVIYEMHVRGFTQHSSSGVTAPGELYTGRACCWAAVCGHVLGCCRAACHTADALRAHRPQFACGAGQGINSAGRLCSCRFLAPSPLPAAVPQLCVQAPSRALLSGWTTCRRWV